jgi:hypothetical protein
VRARLADDFHRARHGLTVAGLILIYRSVDLDAIVRQQSGVLLGSCRRWACSPAFRDCPSSPGRRHAEKQAHSFDLPKRSRAHRRLFHRIQRDEDGAFMFAEFIEIAIIGALFTRSS